MPARTVIACVALLAFGCGGAAPATQAKTAPKPAATPAVASTTPAGFQIAKGPGYSLLVPDDWQRVDGAAGADFAFRRPGGVTPDMAMYAGHLAYPGTPDSFAAFVAQVVERGGGNPVRSSTLEDGARKIPVHELTMVVGAPTVHGVMRIQAGTHHIVTFVCHADREIWSAVGSGCGPIFATIRVGAAAKNARTSPPAGTRWLIGSDWRIAVPSGWIDGGAMTNGVRAISRSGDDEKTLLVVSVVEATPAQALTEKTRDASLKQYADAIVHQEGTHASVAATAPNVITVDFERATRTEPDTTIIQATYVANGNGYVVSCVGLPDAVAAHRALCDTIFRSMRIDGAK